MSAQQVQSVGPARLEAALPLIELLRRTEIQAPSFCRLGVRIHAVQIPEVVETMAEWAGRPVACRFVAATSMHGLVEALAAPPYSSDRLSGASFKEVLASADLVVPDGMPLVWLARREGFDLRRRVYGPELMDAFCRTTGSEFRHFFYGGPPGLAVKLASRLSESYGIKVAGTYSPPFTTLNELERLQVRTAINDASPDIVWVGLSTPKQERWIFENKAELSAGLAVSVGAAFDFISGSKPSAPRVFQENGLEWLYRLAKEPRRLWRRYLLGGPKFLSHIVWEEIRRSWRA